MLKITLQSEAGVLFFQLEGKLAGPWVKELERCWRSAADTQQSYPVRVDLSAVTLSMGTGRRSLGRCTRKGPSWWPQGA
jgi:hypothetical protein